MFESWKIYLKRKIEAASEETRIQNKLHKFFTNNPDVDHYLSDYTRKRSVASIILGIMLGLIIALVVLMFVMTYWVGMGYLKIPGMRW